MSDGISEGNMESAPTNVLPDNFKSVDALVQSYNELQKSFTQVSQKASSYERSQQGVKDFNWGAFAASYYETGEVDSNSYKQLQKAGYSEGFINDYLEGQKALIEQKTSKLYEVVGGKEEYSQLIEWASDNLDDDSKQELNKALLKGGKYAEITLQGLYSQYSNNLSNDRGSLDGASPGNLLGNSQGFSSRSEMVQAINDPKYTYDEGFRLQVQRKIANSNF